MTENIDVQYVVSTVDDVRVTVVRSQETVVLLPPEGKKLPPILVFSQGQAFQLGRALCELGFLPNGEDT